MPFDKNGRYTPGNLGRNKKEDDENEKTRRLTVESLNRALSDSNPFPKSPTSSGVTTKPAPSPKPTNNKVFNYQDNVNKIFQPVKPQEKPKSLNPSYDAMMNVLSKSKNPVIEPTKEKNGFMKLVDQVGEGLTRFDKGVQEMTFGDLPKKLIQGIDVDAMSKEYGEYLKNNKEWQRNNGSESEPLSVRDYFTKRGPLLTGGDVSMIELQSGARESVLSNTAQKVTDTAGKGVGMLYGGGAVKGIARAALPGLTKTGMLKATPQVTNPALWERVGADLSKAALFGAGSQLIHGGITPDIEDRNLAEKAGASLQAGSWDTVQLAGSAAKWLGYKQLGEDFQAKADKQRDGFEVEAPDGPLWQKLLNPEYYATSVARTLPTSLALMPLGMAGMAGGTALAGAMGLGAFGRTVMGALGAGSLTAPFEAALEAGAVYEETGGDAAAADQTFWRNMAVLGVTNSLEFGSMFAPKGITQALDTMGGRVATGALTGAGEETAQSWISQTAKGEDFQFNPEEAVLGGLIGGGLSFVGGINALDESINHIQAIQNRVFDNMTDEEKADVAEARADAHAQGIPQEQADRTILEAYTEQNPEKVQIATQQVKDSVLTAQQLMGMEKTRWTRDEKTIPKGQEREALNKLDPYGTLIGFNPMGQKEPSTYVMPPEPEVPITASQKPDDAEQMELDLKAPGAITFADLMHQPAAQKKEEAKPFNQGETVRLKGMPGLFQVSDSRQGKKVKLTGSDGKTREVPSQAVSKFDGALKKGDQVKVAGQEGTFTIADMRDGKKIRVKNQSGTEFHFFADKLSTLFAAAESTPTTPVAQSTPTQIAQAEAPTQQPLTTAQQIQNAFGTMGAGIKDASDEKTAKEVAEKGYVEFGKEASADLFQQQNPTFIRKLEDGKHRFYPPNTPAEQAKNAEDVSEGDTVTLRGLGDQKFTVTAIKGKEIHVKGEKGGETVIRHQAIATVLPKADAKSSEAEATETTATDDDIVVSITKSMQTGKKNVTIHHKKLSWKTRVTISPEIGAGSNNYGKYHVNFVENGVVSKLRTGIADLNDAIAYGTEFIRNKFSETTKTEEPKADDIKQENAQPAEVSSPVPAKEDLVGKKARGRVVTKEEMHEYMWANWKNKQWLEHEKSKAANEEARSRVNAFFAGNIDEVVEASWIKYAGNNPFWSQPFEAFTGVKLPWESNTKSKMEALRDKLTKAYEELAGNRQGDPDAEITDELKQRVARGDTIAKADLDKLHPDLVQAYNTIRAITDNMSFNRNKEDEDQIALTVQKDLDGETTKKRYNVTVSDIPTESFAKMVSYLEKHNLVGQQYADNEVWNVAQMTTIALRNKMLRLSKIFPQEKRNWWENKAQRLSREQLAAELNTFSHDELTSIFNQYSFEGYSEDNPTKTELIDDLITRLVRLNNVLETVGTKAGSPNEMMQRMKDRLTPKQFLAVELQLLHYMAKERPFRVDSVRYMDGFEEGRGFAIVDFLNTETGKAGHATIGYDRGTKLEDLSVGKDVDWLATFEWSNNNRIVGGLELDERQRLLLAGMIQTKAEQDAPPVEPRPFSMDANPKELSKEEMIQVVSDHIFNTVPNLSDEVRNLKLNAATSHFKSRLLKIMRGGYFAEGNGVTIRASQDPVRGWVLEIKRPANSFAEETIKVSSVRDTLIRPFKEKFGPIEMDDDFQEPTTPEIVDDPIMFEASEEQTGEFAVGDEVYIIESDTTQDWVKEKIRNNVPFEIMTVNKDGTYKVKDQVGNQIPDVHVRRIDRAVGDTVRLEYKSPLLLHTITAIDGDMATIDRHGDVSTVPLSDLRTPKDMRMPTITKKPKKVKSEDERDELDDMNASELQEEANRLRVPAWGTKDQIANRIRKANRAIEALGDLTEEELNEFTVKQLESILKDADMLPTEQHQPRNKANHIRRLLEWRDGRIEEPEPAVEQPEQKEDVRTFAVGVIGGGAVERIEAQGLTFTYDEPNKYKDSGARWDAIGAVALERVQRLQERGVFVVKAGNKAGNTASNEEIKEDTLTQKIANELKVLIRQGTEIKGADLFRISDGVYKGTQGQGRYTPKDAYDALELAVNQYLLEQTDIDFTTRDPAEVKTNVEKLIALQSKLPTQTNRTEEQELYQQFSTPPAIAYVASWIANITNTDTVLEPSAGIGGMALFGKANGAEVIVNELDPRRLEIIRQMPFDQFFKEDGEQIHNIMPKSVKPTVVIMNPPFSTAATRGVKDTKNSFTHVEQALKRLEPGGRLVAVLGLSRDGTITKGFSDWMKKLQERGFSVKAAIGIDGKNYAKYGTTFDVQYLVVDKVQDQSSPLISKVDTLDKAVDLLGGIANERQTEVSGDIGNQQNANQSEGASNTNQNPGGRSGTGSGRGGTSSSSTSGVGGRNGGRTGEVDESGNAVPPANDNGGTSNTAENDGGHNDVRRNNDGEQQDVSGDTNGSGGEIVGDLAEKEDRSRDDSDTGGQSGVKELTDSVFEDYVPKKLTLKNAQKHPGTLAESAAMSAVDLPELTYAPTLPKATVESGALSEAQLEVISYAGQAHEQILPDGERRGFFVGDGTGVGKGRTMAGVILDNFAQGRTKAVWISEKQGLRTAAMGDWEGIGGDGKDLLKLPKLGEPIKENRGVMFTTYTTLASGFDTAGKVTTTNENKESKQTRLQQMVTWLGKDFDGVIIFDEAHNMANAVATRGKRGIKEAAGQALAGIELQRQLPKARIVYASATGATEVSNLAYAERLGLWGKGTAFADRNDFINKIEAGGIAAMELVARDMKSLGAYIARSLSFNGVEYQKVVHDLTPSQTEIYDTMARSWQIVLQNIHEAIKETGGGGKVKGKALGTFWSAQQRFFNQVLTAMQMPAVIAEAKKDLAEGKAVVMQLVNTNEASQDRGIAKIEAEEGSLEDLDLSPKDILKQYLEKSFPTQEYEEYLDDEGNKKWRPVVDSQGNKVHNEEALAMKEDLLMEIDSLRVPESPLELILNTFGVDNVAEVTGRGQRVVERMNETTGKIERILEKLPPSAREVDADAFMDGKKNILIFSDAGGTGRGYHADLKRKNQKQRVHYLIQPGWQATKAVQGFGRTHRTNQLFAPIYKLFTTNLKGQMRFVSSIARRLDQLGALTKGQRQTGSQGLFTAADNLESNVARRALIRFYDMLVHGHLPMDRDDLLKRMGLEHKILDSDGQFNRNAEEIADVPKFLNRILTLESHMQNEVFDTFQAILQQMTTVALQDGTLDTGLENVKADTSKILSETEIFRKEDTGSVTKHYEIELGTKTVKMKLKNLQKYEDFEGVYRNSQSKSVVAMFKAMDKTLEDGRIVKRFQMQGAEQSDKDYTDEDKLAKSRWEKLPTNEEVAEELADTALALQAGGMTEGQAQRLAEKQFLTAEGAWEESVKKVPQYKTETIHLISGTLLPIWDRLPQDRVRVVRVLTGDGKMLLGRIIPNNAINNTLDRLGAERRAKDIDMETLADKVLGGHTIHFANGWRIVRRKIKSEWRIELLGGDIPVYKFFSTELRQAGVFAENIASNYRFFIPTDERGNGIIKAISEHRPIAELEEPKDANAYRSATSIDDMADEINATKTDDDEVNSLGAGFAIPGFGRRAPRPHLRGRTSQKGQSKFAAPGHVEDQIKASRQIQKPRLLQKIGEKLQYLYNVMTREFEHLPKTADFEPLRQKLLQLTNAKSGATFKTYQILLQSITMKLNDEEYDLFERKVIIDDQFEEMERKGALNFTFTEQELRDYKKFLDSEVKKYPRVQDALNTRTKAWDNIKEAYFDAMAAIGYDVRDKLVREHYFRRIVLQHAEKNEQMAGGRAKKLETPNKSSHLRSRSGEFTGNHLFDYLGAESEVMIQMIYDTAKANVIKFVDEKYNKMDFFEDEAKAMNEALMLNIFDMEKRHPNAPKDKKGNPVSVSEMEYKDFNQSMAIGYSGFTKIKPADLWPGDNGEYAAIVKRLTMGVRGNNEGTFQYLSALAEQGGVGSLQAATILKAVANRKVWLEKLLGTKFVTPERLIKQNGYKLWQPLEGSIFYRQNAAEDMAQTADDLFSFLMKTYGVDQMVVDGMIDRLNKAVGKTVLVKGGLRKQFALKPEVATTLDKITDDPDRGPGTKAVRWLTEKFKIANLISPAAIIKYNFRNMTSDLEKTFAGNPKGLKFATRAMSDLFKVYFREGAGTPELRQFIEKGGLQNLQQVQETGDIKYLSHFKHLHKQDPDSNIAKRGLQAYWRYARKGTDFREAILRYANYLSYLDQMTKNKGVPDNYGSSKRELVMSLEDPRDRAYKLANELLIDYTATSVLGKNLSDTGVYPFFRFVEGNLKTTTALFRNVLTDDKVMATVGRKVLGKAVFRSPYIAYRVAVNTGKLTVGLSIVAVLCQLWNNLMWPDEEDRLPDDVKRSMHLIWGVDARGETRYTDRLGFFEDYLSWLGLDNVYSDIRKILDGEKTLKQTTDEMVKTPVKKVISGFSPLMKMPFESASGYSLYPDPFNPQPHNPWYEPMLNMFNVRKEVEAIKRKLQGAPGAPYDWSNFYSLGSDPGEAAYYDVKAWVRAFKKENNLAFGQSEKTPKRDALYNYKLALRYGDTEAMDKYLELYAVYGGTHAGLNQSLESLDPLNGLNKWDAKTFYAELSPRQLEVYDRATTFYIDVLLGPDVVE